ncbi:MAG TPA: glycosyltransferase, partial [Pseudonocardiaceae bacterium]|nr:glycosyltransferase [Pseudonocardiaceae bacterium]
MVEQESAPGVIASDGLATEDAGVSGARPRRRPSPLPRHSAADPLPAATDGILPLDDVGIGARIRRFLLAPPALLTMAMTLLGLLVNRHRLALDLAGGRLLPMESLGQTWSSYLASWHPVGGGSGA